MAKATAAPRARPDTWMPMFWGDYHRDTGHLNATQHGFYLLLIGHYWSTGKPLPDDDAQLWRIARADSVAHWKKNRPIIAAFFKVAQELWRHSRIDRELSDATARAGEAKAKAEKAARARWEGHHDDIPEDMHGAYETDAPSNASSNAPSNAPSTPQAMLEECPPQPQSSSPGIVGRKNGGHDAAASSAAARDAFEAYQARARQNGWPEAQFLSTNRIFAIEQRLRECGGLDGFNAALDAAESAEFLKGQRWFDLDWLLKPENFTRLMEGRYAERHDNGRRQSGQPDDYDPELAGIRKALAGRSVPSG